MITYRINGYSVPKIQAIKLLRGFSTNVRFDNMMVLREAKCLLDDVDQFGFATFEGTYPPGGLMPLYQRWGIDIEIVDPRDREVHPDHPRDGVDADVVHVPPATVHLDLTGDEGDLLQRALETYASLVVLIQSPEADQARALAQKARKASL